jgi:lipoate-protein ligase A
MFCISLDSTDPFFNLALEEVLLKNSREEYLILGINTPSLIIGKHQSPHREVNTQFAFENDIPVIRRISGGGTVFHDTGNLNFTFIRQSEEGRQVDFRKYTRPVINFLSSIGIYAVFVGKNDLKVGGLKISGNAEHVYRNRVLHHGTLLFSTDLNILRNSLRKDTACYSTRGVRSNTSSVTNLSEIQTLFTDIYEFRKAMMNFFIHNLEAASVYRLSDSEIADTEKLAATKYKTWEWNWAYGPEYDFTNNFEINEKNVTCNLFVKDGIINECRITGPDEIVTIGKRLIGQRHMVNDLMGVFQSENISISKMDIYKFF